MDLWHTVPVSPPPTTHTDIVQSDIAIDGHQDHTFRVHGPPVTDILYYRFGFHYMSASYDGVQVDERRYNTVRKTLADTESEIPVLLRAAIIDFVNRLIVTKDSPSLPPSIWDLSNSHIDPLHARLNPNIFIICEIINGVRFYFVRPTRTKYSVDYQWVIATEQAVTAMRHCLRQNWGPSPVEIARCLLVLGIPFRTWAKIPPGFRNPRPVVGLGLRPCGFKPNSADYTAYVAVRDNFLRQPHGRAALLKRGIVWRLAIETIGVLPALSGPSSTAYNYDDHITNPDNGDKVWDDALNEDELDLICGVYKVYTGQGTQHMDLSWWPKHSARAKSGLNVGYWSRSRETWFQRRLQEIYNNTTTLRTGSQWTQGVKFQKDAKWFVEGNEKAAIMYLDGYYFQ